ncbi:TPA: hypothetical protein ACKQFG_003262 [Pseudomonas aeruginosa]|uniref:hypothetical protein n=1 Tax=Pseudomonas aeruginosa TaxID=287 RepID=UPI000F529705|nr:hypothetical protein [Pseudomonas aeruginosa]MBG3998631.1 hypothetical protein [Pseudomonas aeruginosa]MBG4125940.1 hypothetical protein [Pseudomonas aeruginosa]MBH8864895.1 hypothetical protein [Pseudomonas aeruginosa]MCO1680944.1 hypothetical protein [Pseudomonas aeruginosa]MCO1701171.1 hypothetical protein [Pseudomonas aeruginosa]
MNLKALMSSSRTDEAKIDRAVVERFKQVRRQLDEADRAFECRMAAKAVTREQLAKTCSL